MTRNSKEVSREKGSFSIWLDENEPNVIAIVISESSHNGELYKWETMNNDLYFNFSGYFFVDKIIGFTEFDKYNKSNIRNIPVTKEWKSKFDDNENINIIRLTPISKKEIEGKKYQ